MESNNNNNVNTSSNSNKEKPFYSLISVEIPRSMRLGIGKSFSEHGYQLECKSEFHEWTVHRKYIEFKKFYDELLSNDECGKKLIEANVKFPADYSFRDNQTHFSKILVSLEKLMKAVINDEVMSKLPITIKFVDAKHEFSRPKDISSHVLGGHQCAQEDLDIFKQQLKLEAEGKIQIDNNNLDMQNVVTRQRINK